jgi:hypothetical protein
MVAFGYAPHHPRPGEDHDGRNIKPLIRRLDNDAVSFVNMTRGSNEAADLFRVFAGNGLAAKEVQLLHELVPKADLLGFWSTHTIRMPSQMRQRRRRPLTGSAKDCRSQSRH